MLCFINYIDIFITIYYYVFLLYIKHKNIAQGIAYIAGKRLQCKCNNNTIIRLFQRRKI